jgi:anti-sigma regulatory factor (Ser/Thr protein kinase)
MHNQSVRLFLYSSTAIIILTMLWAFRVVPQQGELADRAQKASLEQELTILSSAVRTSTQALKYRLLDVLKAEGNDRPTRAFQDSPFITAALLEWDQTAWKVLWNSSKQKNEMSDIRTMLQGWPLAKMAPDEVHFAKVGDIQGQAYFVLIAPVRKPNNVPMMGVGIFPAGAFGLSFASDRARDTKVFDSQGFALALRHPAYVGASLTSDPLVEEILGGEDVSVRHEWKGDRGSAMLGAALRIPDSNLVVAVETAKTPSSGLSLWLYLLFSAAGAIALNWALLSGLVRPLFKQLAQTEELSEQLKRQLAERQNLEPRSLPRPVVLAEPDLPDVDFTGRGAVGTAPKTVSLGVVIQAALRSLDTRIRESAVNVKLEGLVDIPMGTDVLQLQTAMEEVLKNAVEAMESSSTRELIISAEIRDRRVQLKIRDRGEGISDENLKKVFDPFFSTKDSQGVARGLGLNVVRRVFEEIGGKVRLNSRVGEGTTVEMEWAALEESRPVSGSLSPAPEISMKDMLFLDNELNREDEDEFTARPVGDMSRSAIRKPRVRTMD